MANMSGVPHNIAVQQGTGASGPVLGAGPIVPKGISMVKVTLKAGTYTYFCQVAGHRAAGMFGTLDRQVGPRAGFCATLPARPVFRPAVGSPWKPPPSPARPAPPAEASRCRRRSCGSAPDEQLVALFRAGSDEAFGVIHERYRVRLMAYSRQMLGGSHADAEDVLQDVFVRAHAALRATDAPIALRAWLYRIAHNRCVDGLRRPAPMPSEIMPGAQPALSRGAHHDPPVEAERSEDLRRLVRDLLALPEQQRSALLMRELQGLPTRSAATLGVSVGAVKSLLVRARAGVASAAWLARPRARRSASPWPPPTTAACARADRPAATCASAPAVARIASSCATQAGSSPPSFPRSACSASSG